MRRDGTAAMVKAPGVVTGARSTNPFDDDDGGPAVGQVDDNERYTVFFVPHLTVLAEKLLSDSGVLQHCDVNELHLDLVPFDDDLVSCELPSALRHATLESVPAPSNYTVARSILRVQKIYGVVPNVIGVGVAAEGVIEKMVELRREEEGGREGGRGDKGEGEEEEEEEDDDEGGDGREGVGPDGRRYSEIDTLLLIDREVDFVTPLLTPLTYEGLIDEVVGIQHGYVKVDPALVEIGDAGKKVSPAAALPPSPPPPPPPPTSTASPPQKMVAIPLNSSDPLFHVVRSQNIEKLGSFLQDAAKSIQESYATFRENKDASINEIHKFVKQIPGLNQNYKSLNQHINFAELIKKTTDSVVFRSQWQAERGMLEGEQCYEYIEALISRQAPVYQVLKLICLQSLTSGGLKSSKYDQLKREVVQTYGFPYSSTLQNLESLGAIKRREMTWSDSGNSWTSLRRTLKLIVEDVDVQDPTDVAYVSSGYAPLSVRLIQAFFREGGAADLRGLARVVELVQTREARASYDELTRRGREQKGEGSGGRESADKILSKPPKAGKKKVLFVYFVGGITLMEIAALRFLNNEKSFPFEVLIGTTKVLNGEGLLRGLS